MPPIHATKTVTLLASAARTASANGSAVILYHQVLPHTGDRSGFTASGIFALDVTASSGTSITLDVVLQGRTTGTGTWVNIPGGTFARKTGNGAEAIRLDGPLMPEMRAAATIAGTTPSFTFSVIGIVGG